MAAQMLQPVAVAAWRLAQAQHWVVTREQLLQLGFTPAAIKWRVQTGRLHRLWDGVYAVGHRGVTRLGRWKAATLACGPHSALCGGSGGTLVGLCDRDGPRIEVAVPPAVVRSREGIDLRRVERLADHTTHVRGVPVCRPPLLLVQLSARLDRDSVEALINRADNRDLIDPETLRAALALLKGRPGVAQLRSILDRATFQLSRSKLERLFRPLARRAGLGEYLMGRWVNGFEVDFWFPALNYVVETDGLRYHRTPQTQTRDLRRDQAHDRAGTWHSRFSHAQIAFERAYVAEQLVAKRRQIEAVHQTNEGSGS
jgi:very-short-patch-repair endonuclease